MTTKTATKATIDTATYFASHWTQPKGFGYWIFENTTTGEQVNVPCQFYGTAVKQLPAGTWKVLP